MFSLFLVSSAVGPPVEQKLHSAIHAHGMGLLAKAHANHLTKFGAPTPGQKYHDGLYVDGCKDLSHGGYFKQDGRNFSVASTYLFDESNNFKMDQTVYVGDSDCSPVASDVFSKAMFQGKITYHTISLNPVKIGAIYQPTQGEYVVPGEISMGEVNELNQYCGSKCGVDWRHTGQLLSIAAHDCHDVGSMPPNAPALCRQVVGEKYFNAFQYSNSYFVQSAGAYNEAEGWSEPLDIVNHVNWIQPSHQQDPGGCTLINAKCMPYLLDVNKTCETCDRLRPTDPDSKIYSSNFLECDGCAYRQAPTPHDFGNCCPCFYFYAQQNSRMVVPYFGHLNC